MAKSKSTGAGPFSTRLILQRGVQAMANPAQPSRLGETRQGLVDGVAAAEIQEVLRRAHPPSAIVEGYPLHDLVGDSGHWTASLKFGRLLTFLSEIYSISLTKPRKMLSEATYRQVRETRSGSLWNVRDFQLPILAIVGPCSTPLWTVEEAKPSRVPMEHVQIAKCAMVAKCGPRVVHHWAHASRRNCDPWWENETDWHREWKNRFPAECRERSHTAPNGEIHRADIKTPTGIVIEVQHSTMTDEERESRESFYKNLLWILDGKSFQKNFHIGCMLPDPSAEWVRDVVWNQHARSAYQRSANHIQDCIPSFWRISDLAKKYPGLTKMNIRERLPAHTMVLFHSDREVAAEARADYKGHHQFYWTRPRRTWLDAKCPVYIDFGGGCPLSTASLRRARPDVRVLGRQAEAAP